MTTHEIVRDLVSTIIPVYNRGALLREAVDSVARQDWQPIEIIVIDDGSTDDTPAVAHELERRLPGVLRVVSQTNSGVGAARECGRLEARGEFIQYLDSDDLLLPGKFRAQVEALRAQPECGVAYGMTRFRSADGTALPGAYKDSGIARDTMFPSFLLERWWDTATPLYRRSVCDRAGPWSDLRLEEDWEYDCRIAAMGTRIVWCDRFVSEYRDHSNPRLSRGDALDPARMMHRARSHCMVYAHARRAGISSDTPEMQKFARTLFMMARQCGASGLPRQARELFLLSQQAAGILPGRAGWDLRAYSLLASIFGWRAMGSLSQRIDRWRHR